MKYVSTGQSHAAMAVLAQNVPWEALSGDILQKLIDDPTRAGINFTRFLMDGAGVDNPLPTIQVNYSRSIPWAGETFTAFTEVSGAEQFDPSSIERVRISKAALQCQPEELHKFLWSHYGSRLLDFAVMKALLAKANSWMIPASWRQGRTCFPNRMFRQKSGAPYLPGITFDNLMHSWNNGGVTFDRPRDDFYLALRAS